MHYSCETLNERFCDNNQLNDIDLFSFSFLLFKGLERVIISKTFTQFFHDKVEQLALDLVKIENEQFSLLALKLLVTCMYIGNYFEKFFLDIKIKQIT